MKNLVSSASAIFVFMISLYHITGFGNYLLAQRGGILPWHLWAVSILGCGTLAIFSGFSYRLPKATIPYLVWCAGFISICGFSILLVNRGITALDALTSYVWFFAVSVSLVILVRTPLLVRACGFGAVAAVVVMSVLTIMEFFDPNFQVIVDRYFADISEVGTVNRAGAFHINPNNNGGAIALGMFCGLLFLPRFLRLPFILLAGFAIFGTVSRSSLTIWALATLYFFSAGHVFRSRIAGNFLGIIVIGGLGTLLAIGQIPVIIDSLGMESLLTSGMRERLTSGFFTQVDGSTLSRLEAAEASFAAFVDNPVLGIGLGETDLIAQVGSHNQHLKIAAEMGIFGYLVFAALFLIAINTGSMSAIFFVTLYFVLGMAFHGLLHFAEYAVLIPLAIIFIPKMTEKSPTKKRRRKRRHKTSSFSEQQLSA